MPVELNNIKKIISLTFFIFSCFGCEKDVKSTNIPIYQETLRSTITSPKPNTTPTPTLIDENFCHQVIEIDKNNIHYKSFEQFKVGYVMPFKTVFINCNFKDEDVKQHTFSLIKNGNFFIFSSITEEQTKPVKTTASPSFCSFYFFTGQTDISLLAKTELKNGEVIRSLPFTLHLDSDHIKYCETPGTPLISH